MLKTGVRVAEIAWPQLAEIFARSAPAILPIGAAAKEHGRHLPLATDYLQAEWLTDQLVACREVVAWPTLSYGFYPVFVDYPGSISLSRATFIEAVCEILDGIAQAGPAQIVILNTGISTIEPLRIACARPRAVTSRLINVYSGGRFAACKAQLEQQAFGGHADEVETSLLMEIASTLVRLAEARPAPTAIARGLFNRQDARFANYSPDGVNGNPCYAAPEKGKLLAAALLADVLAALDGKDDLS